MKEIEFKDLHTAALFAQSKAIIKIIALILSFLFWLFAALVLLFLQLYGVISMDFFGQLPRLIQILGLLGISPIVLAVISWKLFDFACRQFIYLHQNKTIRAE